jgi:hypothetical protein
MATLGPLLRNRVINPPTRGRAAPKSKRVVYFGAKGGSGLPGLVGCSKSPKKTLRTQLGFKELLLLRIIRSAPLTARLVGRTIRTIRTVSFFLRGLAIHLHGTPSKPSTTLEGLLSASPVFLRFPIH